MNKQQAKTFYIRAMKDERKSKVWVSNIVPENIHDLILFDIRLLMDDEQEYREFLNEIPGKKNAIGS